MKHVQKNAHKAGKAYHKNEMEHHKLRDRAKAAHERSAPDNHALPEYSKIVNENHQEGIARVKQRPGDMPVGQHGSLAGGWKHEGLK